MKNKQNSYELSDAAWIDEITVCRFKKPESFYLSDRYRYGTAERESTVRADAHGMFRLDSQPGEILRCRFSLFASERRYVTLIVSGNASFKVWQNGRLLGIHKICSPVLTVRLAKGENCFCVDAYCPEEAFELQIRRETAASAAAFAAGSADNMELSMPALSLYLPRRCYPEGEAPTYIVTPTDHRAFHPAGRYSVRLFDHATGRLVYARRQRFGRLYRIPHGRLRYREGHFNRIDMVISARDRFGRIQERKTTLYHADFEDTLPELLSDARICAERRSVPAERRDTIMSLCKRIEAPESKRYLRLLFAEILKGVLEDDTVCTEAEIYRPGTKRVFFDDPLDGSRNYYRMTLPEGYDPEREYPLLLLCSTKEYGSFGMRFGTAGFPNLLVADVSIRGVTLGSYIGEAALLNALSDIQRRFRIDADRIYIGGYSNGASAALAAAQAYPHLFAGVYALSGRAEYAKMDNLSNLYTVLMSAPDDEYYDNAVRLQRSCSGEAKNIRLFLLACHSHLTIQRVWLNRQSLAALMTRKREKYPTHISYRTNRDRHLQAYWITLHGIKPQSEVCKLTADAGKSRIDIRVRGAVGLSVTLPPFIDRACFTVRINGKETVLKNFTGEQLHFVHGSHGFRLTDTPPLRLASYKGNGLLDVYLDPLCVVIPNRASDTVKKAAHALARPQSNGSVPEIAVWYPTLTSDELTKDNRLFGSLIAVGNGSDLLFQSLNCYCAIRPGREGYTYNGEFFKTPYCVMQMLENPWNRSRHILYVTYNDEKLLRRNLFTRCMTLPSYFGGKHPYLNGAALVFDGKRYYTVKAFGAPLTEIGSTQAE